MSPLSVALQEPGIINRVYRFSCFSCNGTLEAAVVYGQFSYPAYDKGQGLDYTWGRRRLTYLAKTTDNNCQVSYIGRLRMPNE